MSGRALIGHTGFVGSNLLQEGRYDALFNSANSMEMRGQNFAEVVCAGASAVKWKANADPAADWAAISALIGNLLHLKANRFVLISTVDVYQPPLGVTEDDPASEDGAAYGVHRTRLERLVANTFPKHLILRLPALYGRNLKKNALYDLRHDNMVAAIDARGSFQWYDARRLERDIASIAKTGLQVVNITAEPVKMSEIADRFFPGKLSVPDETKILGRYDMQTKYAHLLGGSGRYHFDRQAVLDGIGDYLAEGL